MPKLQIHHIYRWHAQQPPSELVQAFNALLAFPTVPPDLRMRLHATGETLQKQIEYAQKTHQTLQKSYMEPAEDDETIPGWLGEDEEAQKLSQETFMSEFEALLNTEIEIPTIRLSALMTASERYWLMVERGMANGHVPLDQYIDALRPVIEDDVTEADGNTTKKEAAKRRQERK